MTSTGIGERSDRARRRDFIRSHHPDRGGDPAMFITGLARLTPSSTTAEPVVVRVVARPRQRVHRQLCTYLRRRVRPAAPRVR